MGCKFYLTHKNHTDKFDNVDMPPNFHQHLHFLYEVIHNKLAFVVHRQVLDRDKLIFTITSLRWVRIYIWKFPVD